MYTHAQAHTLTEDTAGLTMALSVHLSGTQQKVECGASLRGHFFPPGVLLIVQLIVREVEEGVSLPRLEAQRVISR